jgi:SAM-dependent methyltransferase
MTSQSENHESEIYTAALAEAYETVMAHVDYPRWASYAHDLLQAHASPKRGPLGPRRLLELGCGTGALARHLQPRGPYRYLATDASEAMLDVARRKARAQSLPLRFQPARFTRVADDLAEGEAPFDAALLLYDGLNYLLEERRVRRLLAEVARVLRPGGLFLFDHATPANSADGPDPFEYEGVFEDERFEDACEGRYWRTSRYDPGARLHHTTFELSGPAGSRTERHVQRVYDPGEVRALLHRSPLAPVAAYDGLTTDPATPQSHRVHWLARSGTGECGSKLGRQ